MRSITNTGSVDRPVGSDAHVFAVPVVRELPQPPVGADATGTW